MDTVDFVRRTVDALHVANRDDVISRYQRLRAVGQELNNKLVNRLSKDVMNEGATKLGILQNGTFVFETEDEVSILSDYCIYDVRRNGRNAIDQYLIDSPPAPESDEMVCLRSMQRTFYSLFVVESVEWGLGVIVRDLLSSEILFIMDMGMGRSAQPGLFFAARILHRDGLSMTSGAAMVIGVVPAHARGALIKELAERPKPDDGGDFDPTSLIRACLRMGCVSRVQYVDPWEVATIQQRNPNRIRSTPVGRNSPCPCGSGKKFKRCCVDRV